MKDLLLKLMQMGINIEVVNDELQLSNIPPRFQESDLMVELKMHKKEVIDYVKKRKQANTEVKAIAKASAKELYNASPQQRRLFFLHQIAPSSLFYNISQAYSIKGHLEIEKLKKSFQLLIERHETLRTSFSIVDKKVVQKIEDEALFNLEYIKAGNEEIDTVVTKFIRPFDLTENSLFRGGLIEVAQDEHILVLDMHHLISDGVSQQILIKEFAAAYNNRYLSKSNLQYKDYSEWVHDFPRDHWHSLKGFWMKTFANTPKPCQLPLDFSRPETKNYDGNTITFSIDKTITKQLYALAHSANTSLFTVLISAFSILLSKLTNQEDLVIGTPVSGRTHPDLDNIVGLFVNTLPIRLLPDAKLTYRSYLEQVSSGVLECFDHQDYPLEQLIDDLKLDRNLSHNPLFDVVFVLQNMEESAAAFEDIEISSYSLNNKSSKFDLTLAAAESSGSINFNFEFSKQLFKQDTVERFAGYFRKILADIAQNENVILEDVEMLSDDEKDFLLNVNNKLSVGYPKDKTIVDLFEEQVKQRPSAVAVVFEDKELTYQELNQRSNQLARILRSKGCVANMIVGLLTGRGHETVIAMLAILKAGGAYLPIDIDYPAERIEFILSNSGVKLLVTDSSQADVISAYQHQYIFTDHIVADINDSSNLELEISPDDLCYIIYTSGTTGKPKGAMIEHKNVVRLLFNDDFQFDFGPEDIWTMFHSHTFDFSVWEMYGALLYGGKLIIIKKEEALDPVKYLKILDTQNVTVLNQTPTAFGNLIQEDLKREPSLSSLRYVIFGGEALQPFKLKRWYGNYPNVKLVNMFGITETTVHVTYKEITSYEIENNLPNVGKPIPCTSVYVFTPKMQLAPLGVIAELYVGGEGVARGYLNNPDLTLQRFLVNPFRPDERLYRTGDLGRIMENGEIEYFGRADRQVQLRGFRIEPGEIEFHLSNHPSIDYTLVTLKNREDGTTYLCAYYIGKAVIPSGEIREFLQDKIPAYMIPSYFIPISHLPQTGNDKIDISKLPEPEVTAQADHTEPKTFLEKNFVKIWSEELSVKDLGVTDNFFAIGGDSLKAIGVIHRINTEFNCNLSIADLYKNQTIATLATLMQSGQNYDIDDSYNAALEELRSFQENYYQSENWDDSYEEVFPMSGIEKGMMFYSLKQSSDKQNIHDTSYHEQNTYKIANRNFDFNIFKQAVALLVEKHSELRKIYDLKNFAHIIKKHIEPELNYIDVSDLHPDAQESFVLQRIEDEKLKTTGLDYSVLWRMNIFKIDEISYLLIFDMHHSLFDGWSLHSFITELNNTYKFLLTDSSFKPEKLQCSYEDHIVYELAEAKKTENISFWRDEMAGSNRLGFPRKRKDNTFSYRIFNLGEEMKSDLERLAKKYNTSLKHICFGAYVNAMKLYTSETDIVVGLATNNRPLVADSEKLLGCFLNSVPFRIAVPENISGGEYIKLIESKLQTLKKHERVSLEEIVQITDHRSQGDNPFFDTFFNYVNFRVLNEMLGLDGAETFNSPYQDKLDAVSYLNVNTFCEFHVLPDPFALCISYATAYFDESVIETLYQCFFHTLSQVIKNEDLPLLQIDIISPTDRNKLLNEFNDTSVAYPKDQTVIDQFEAQAGRTPDATAIMFGKDRMSYRELSLRADHEASLLIAHGVKQDEVVGLMSERSFELLIGMLGILKAGAAYMPLDPNYPADRISYMLEDSGARLVLASSSCKASFSGDQEVIAITAANSPIPEQKKTKSLAQAESLAYVIYTSGSTGRPKGVMIPHVAVTNFSKGMSDLIEFAGKTLLSVTTFSFDIFVLESLVPLQYGATIVLADDNEQHDPSLLEAAIIRNKVNMLQITPSLMKAVTEHAGSLKALGRLTDIMIGGEAFPPALLQTLQQNTKARIFNMYGPTETTVWSSVKELTKEQEITIGKPIANTQVYILDKGNRLQPAGVAGELCISGDGLSRGYLNKPELTAERFIDHPYKEGEKLYRTGDLARWLPDGNIEHLGRMDDQVKIRGYRIELGEIESQLLSYENIKEAIVVAKERNGEKYLVGYYVSAEELSTALLKAHLSGVLPDYMIPQVFVQLTELPLTPNGKTDRKALPEPDYGTVTVYTAPETELEEKLAGIWSEVLQLDKDQISVTAGFFDLGGHSLKATTLVNRIYKELQVEVPLKAIFSHQDIRSLGAYISGLGKTAYEQIEKAARKAHYALSSGQQRMYFLYELDRTSLAYNMPYVVELEGELDEERLNTAFRSLIERHESLRTTFEVVEGEVHQRIHQETNFTISHYEATGANAIDATINSFIRPFDLTAGPLLRIGLVKVSEDNHLLLADMHHIITDGVSQGILIRDFMELYEKGSLPALALQYKDYSEWQHSQTQQEQLSSQRSYWKEKFAGELSVLDLPADHTRPQVKNYQGSSQSFMLNREETQQLKALGEKSEATLFMTLLSVLNVLLGKLGNQEDITIGTPIAGRYHAELEGIIGLFVNTLALRNQPKGELSFREFLEEVKISSLLGFEHQLYPYEELVNELELPRDTGRNPLFDVMFTFQNFRQDELQIPGLQLKFRDADHGISKFDIEIVATVFEDELHFTFEYSTALFEAETIDRFISYFKRIVTEVTADADKKLSQIDILSPSERNRILNEFNDTAVAYPRDKTIIDLFEAQAERTPDNIAVIYGTNKLTYKELNEKADQLAAYLQQAEVVKTGDKVGLLLEREEELFPSIFGILKAGAVYVPLSVHYPSARLNTIIADAGLKVLITRTRHIEALLPEMETGVLNLDILAEKIQASSGALQGITGPADLAYIIYTSGSTGQPKGVMIEHGSVVNRLVWMQEQYPLSSKDVLLQKTSLVFDVSVWELLWWSFTGASVCVPAPGTEKDPAKLIAEIAEHGVTTIHFVPSMLSVFLDAAQRDKTGRLNMLRQVFASGEALGAEQVNRFSRILYQANGTRLINLYGPTEATVDVTYYECDLGIKNELIPIGKPIANTQMYVVDKNSALSPLGVAGELCISGDGLSRGYLNKPELTAERFIDHPYKAGEKLYRTGDLARWLPDGNIEYLGRIDDQVKVRGYRIELGEIESQLVSHPEIREVVIVTREREGEKYLVGYYVSDDVLNISDLKVHLSKTLPEYMIPSYFVHLTAIPLSINGKTDRKSLPKPEFTIGESYIAPSNETERKLTAIWSEVLELDQNAISADANFFELGGHSIHAVQVTNKIQGIFSVEMGLRQIFESNTVAELARFIESAQPGSESSIPKTERKQYYLTSPAQERMYFGYLLDTANTSRNISSMIELSMAPDIRQLEKAFQALIKRHSGLRTCFELTTEGVVQQILPDVNFELKCFDLGNETLESSFIRFIQPFDLSKAPLIKALVVKAANKNYLFIDIHHIVCDGTSVNILTRDLRDLYLGKKLPELELEYIDFAEWVRKEAGSQEIHREYWSNKLSGDLKRLNLPVLQERELAENNAVSQMIFSIGNDLYRKIKSFSREAEVTDFMFFLSVYYLMLNKITGDRDVIIGTDAIGRSSKDLQEIVGTFVNILPLRVDVNGSNKYSKFLDQVKECVLEAFDHQAYPYDQIVSLVSSEINQLVDVHFSFDNTIDNGQELEELQFKNVAFEEEGGADHRNADVTGIRRAEYDLEVVVSENDEQFQVLFNYNSSLYDDDTTKIFIDIFTNIISDVVNNPKIEIDKIGIESEVSMS